MNTSRPRHKTKMSFQEYKRRYLPSSTKMPLDKVYDDPVSYGESAARVSLRKVIDELKKTS